MPGIVGFVSTKISKENARPTLKKMQELITHKSFHVLDELFENNQIYATRTHINVIQKTPQPFINNGIYVWLDGEFYNQSELMPNGFSLTDPEILARLYHQQPNFDFLKEIDGIFSAVIYDSNRQQVHLLTDRYGLRHLYWAKYNDCLIWSSEVKTFLAFPGFIPTIDRQAVKEFFSVGYLLENRTWFEGVELLHSGTVLTWDIATSDFISHQYWWWDQIKPLTGKIDEQEIVEELGSLFSQAVERRTHQTEKIGLTLSGGLDSRAILAAMPDYGNPIHALTFGKLNCDDARIAKKIADIKGAIHHIFEITNENWLAPRLEGIWWTDGQMDLMHMHGVEMLKKVREFFQISLNGFLGDALLGGSYIDNIEGSSLNKYQHRGRRFISMGPKLAGIYIHLRKPFFDNQLINLTVSIPESMRANSYIYNKMLLHKYPTFFQSIPWQKTGLPISSPQFTVKVLHNYKRIKNRLLCEISKFGLQYSNLKNYTDYPNWIRQEPARSFFTQKLRSSSAIYPEYIDKNRVIEELKSHFNGKDYSNNLCRYLTFEIWLQQVFEGKYRKAEH